MWELRIPRSWNLVDSLTKVDENHQSMAVKATWAWTQRVALDLEVEVELELALTLALALAFGTCIAMDCC